MQEERADDVALVEACADLSRQRTSVAGFRPQRTQAHQCRSQDLAYAKKKLAIYVKPIGDVWGDHYF